MMNAIRKLVRDQRGASMTEYIILIALIAIVGLVGFKNFGGKVKESIDNATKQMDTVVEKANGG